MTALIFIPLLCIDQRHCCPTTRTTHIFSSQQRSDMNKQVIERPGVADVSFTNKRNPVRDSQQCVPESVSLAGACVRPRPRPRQINSEKTRVKLFFLFNIAFLASSLHFSFSILFSALSFIFPTSHAPGSLFHFHQFFLSCQAVDRQMQLGAQHVGVFICLCVLFCSDDRGRTVNEQNRRKQMEGTSVLDPLFRLLLRAIEICERKKRCPASLGHCG